MNQQIGGSAMKPTSWSRIVISSLVIGGSLASFAQDGGPADLGPADVHEVSKKDLNQKILVIYVQANDYRIFSSDLATENDSENKKISNLEDWFEETSWNQCTFAITQRRAAGNNWYTLPEGILDYASPSGITSMHHRDSTQASTSNPTPPASVTALATAPGSGDPASKYDDDQKCLDCTPQGDYRFAVSSFANGVESRLTKVGSVVSVAKGDIVKLTITRAATDVDRYIVYRTGKGKADSLGNYRRIGYAAVTGATDQYIDTGQRLAHLANHNKLLTAAMEAADPDVPNFEDYNGVIVIIYSSFLRGQAAQAITFTVNGVQFMIQTINQSSATEYGRFCHEMGHWLRLPDQYGGGRHYWTTMDHAKDRQYATWEKDYKLAWIIDLDSDPSKDNLKFLKRPGPSDLDINQTFKVLPTAAKDTYTNVYTAIKIKSSDSVHYYVEGRDQFPGNVSDATATNHVVVMEAVDAWPPGIYPKRTLNEQKVLASGDPAHKPESPIEITFTGINSGPPETYNVNVKIKAEEQPDPKITPWGAPPWETTDIWVDSEREGGGWDNPATAAPKQHNGEAAWVNHVNRVYARITNVGLAEAKDVQVRFRENTPGGIGDAGQFIDLPNPPKVDIPVGGWKNVYAEWTPKVGTHTCVQVEIEHLPGEKDIYNNFAQENVTHFYSGSSSPWKAVAFQMPVANPLLEPRRVELEVNGLQSGWKASLDHKWVMLEPQGLKTVNVTITPPATADRCTKLQVDVYGLIQIDDYIQVYGGLNPIIHLADPIQFMRVTIAEEQQEEPDPTREFYRISGLTYPEVPNAEVALIVTRPNGNYLIVFVRTDGGGAFSGTFFVDTPGQWTVQTYFAGDDCNAPSESGITDFFVEDAGLPYELANAFAFGADEWTRTTYNEPSVQYIKINQGAEEANIQYSSFAGYGYVDSASLDRSPNNRDEYAGNDEIYDQFIGVKSSEGPPPMRFRIDVPNGTYRFVAAGGDADYFNHSTTIRARDGDTDDAIVLVDDYQPKAPGQFWTVEFDDKIVPPSTTRPPYFFPQKPSPTLEVTQGYIIIEQDLGFHPEGIGGDLCLLELWVWGGVNELPSPPCCVEVKMLPAGHLTWTAPSEAGIAGYRVYRSVNGGGWEQIAYVTGTSHVDPSVVRGSDYSYRVTAVNEDGAEGPPSSPTADFILVDDFESYHDNIDAGTAIFQTWLNGFENGTGAIVGYLRSTNGTFTETGIVHWGRQSMPFGYSNVDSPYYSEAERTWTTPHDWTINGVDTLTLYVRGQANNEWDSLYVALQDSAGYIGFVAHPDPAIVTALEWTEWQIPMSEFSNAGVNPVAVKKMYIGVGNRNALTSGGTGLIYIDDIRVITSEPADR